MNWGAFGVIISITVAVMTGTWLGLKISMKLGAILQQLETVVQEQIEMKGKKSEHSQRTSEMDRRLSRIEGKLGNGSRV